MRCIKSLKTDSRLFFVLFLFVFFYRGEGVVMGSLVKCEAAVFFKLYFELLSREQLELSNVFIYLFFLKVSMLPSCFHTMIQLLHNSQTGLDRSEDDYY